MRLFCYRHLRKHEEPTSMIDIGACSFETTGAQLALATSVKRTQRVTSALVVDTSNTA